MISRRRAQTFFSSSKSSHVLTQPVKAPAPDPMVASYDDVFSFSEDEDNETAETSAPQSKSIRVRERVQQLQGVDQNGNVNTKAGTNMKSSNGIIVLPQGQQREEAPVESRVKLKPRSASHHAPKKESLSDELSKIIEERQRKLVAVVPPKPPQTFSTFQTLPNRKPAITAPKPRLPASNSFSASCKSTKTPEGIGKKPLTTRVTEDQTEDIQGRVKVMQRMFATGPYANRARPPIPTKKDYGAPEKEIEDAAKIAYKKDQREIAVDDARPDGHPMGPVSKAANSETKTTEVMKPLANEVIGTENGEIGSRRAKPLQVWHSMRTSPSAQSPPAPASGRSHKPLTSSRSLELKRELVRGVREETGDDEKTVGNIAHHGRRNVKGAVDEVRIAYKEEEYPGYMKLGPVGCPNS